MAAIVALFGAVGSLPGGAQGMLLALALAMNAWAFLFSDRVVLGFTVHRERILQRRRG